MPRFVTVNKEAETYFAEATGWEFDRSAALRRSARLAWIVALAATAMAVMATGAIALLTPLKRVDPFVVRVDSSTGIVDVVPGYAGAEPMPEAVTRYLVTQYVIGRERFVPALAEADYEQTGAYHSAAMNQRWAGAWARTNPDSPLNRYADGTSVRAQVQSVSFLNQNHAGPELVQVRFVSAALHGGGGEEERAHYVATLQVAFGKPSTDVRLRALNPLGFKVLEYRREPEVVEASAASQSAASPAAPAAPAATGGAP